MVNLAVPVVWNHLSSHFFLTHLAFRFRNRVAIFTKFYCLRLPKPIFEFQREESLRTKRYSSQQGREGEGQSPSRKSSCLFSGFPVPTHETKVDLHSKHHNTTYSFLLMFTVPTHLRAPKRNTAPPKTNNAFIAPSANSEGSSAKPMATMRKKNPTINEIAIPKTT